VNFVILVNERVNDTVPRHATFATYMHVKILILILNLKEMMTLNLKEVVSPVKIFGRPAPMTKFYNSARTTMEFPLLVVDFAIAVTLRSPLPHLSVNRRVYLPAQPQVQFFLPTRAYLPVTLPAYLRAPSRVSFRRLSLVHLPVFLKAWRHPMLPLNSHRTSKVYPPAQLLV